MIYFKFNSPLKKDDRVEIIIGNEKWEGRVYGEYYCYIGTQYHSKFCGALRNECKEYFDGFIRPKYLKAAGFAPTDSGYFPEFPTLKELQRFLEFINDNYSEI